MFKNLKQIVIKSQELFQYFINFTRDTILKNKDLLMPLLFLYFFSPFLIKIFAYIQAVKWQNISLVAFRDEFANFISAKSFDGSILLIPLALGFVCFDFIFRFAKKKKKGFIGIFERFFSIIPYLLFIVEMSYTLVDFLMIFVQSMVAQEDLRQFCASYIFPVLTLYAKLPGLTNGLFGFFIFYFNYFYIARNKLKYSHFLRYHYTQSMLANCVYSLVTHLFFIFLKYNKLSDLKDFMGFNIYAFFLFVNVIFIFSALFGKETKIPFLDEAVLYHIGPRKNSSDQK
jgi:hypothetical protein